MDPIVYIGENFSRLFGPVFFMIVVFMIVTVSAVFYICLLPHVWGDSKGWTSLHLVFGHLVLVNTLFHYYKGEVELGCVADPVCTLLLWILLGLI